MWGYVVHFLGLVRSESGRALNHDFDSKTLLLLPMLRLSCYGLLFLGCRLVRPFAACRRMHGSWERRCVAV